GATHTARHRATARGGVRRFGHARRSRRRGVRERARRARPRGGVLAVLMAGSSHRLWRRARLTTHAWLGLLAFDAARLAGFAHIHDWLSRVRPAARRSAATAEEIVWAVDEACVWYFARAACLQRSIVAAWLLRRH